MQVIRDCRDEGFVNAYLLKGGSILISLSCACIRVCVCVCICTEPGVGRSGLHTAGSSRWLEFAQHTPTHRSLSKTSSFTSVYLFQSTHTHKHRDTDRHTCTTDTNTHTHTHACMIARLHTRLKKPPTAHALTCAHTCAVRLYIRTHEHVPSRTAPESYVTPHWRHGCLGTLRLMMRLSLSALMK